MSSIHPEGESLRRAVRFISDKLRDDPEQDVMPLVNEATLKFDLNPNEAEYLINFYRKPK